MNQNPKEEINPLVPSKRVRLNHPDIKYFPDLVKLAGDRGDAYLELLSGGIALGVGIGLMNYLNPTLVVASAAYGIYSIGKSLVTYQRAANRAKKLKDEYAETNAIFQQQISRFSSDGYLVLEEPIVQDGVFTEEGEPNKRKTLDDKLQE